MRTKRTDAHRPSAIIPAHYSVILSYSCATTDNGWPVPSMGVNCELDKRQIDSKTGAIIKHGEHCGDSCCVIRIQDAARREGMQIFGSPGKCGVCGAIFVYGDVWRHDSGDVVHMGHDCASKYEMIVDRSEWELMHGRMRAANAAQIIRAQNAKERSEFLAAHPGLEDALATDHKIVKEVAARFQQYRSLSDKQVALVLKLAAEAKNPPPADRHVTAPLGRATFTGVVVSSKVQDGMYRDEIKITVKVTTDAGAWFAWGTAPASLLGSRPLKGASVEITATLVRGRDLHFAIMKRPRGRFMDAMPVEA